MSADDDIRKLQDLRVVDLKCELEKRSLDKTGNKQVLLDRLHKAMKGEGLDPETHKFENAKRLSTSSRDIEENVNEEPVGEVEKLEAKVELVKIDLTEKNNNSENVEQDIINIEDSLENEEIKLSEESESIGNKVSDIKVKKSANNSHKIPVNVTLKEELESIDVEKSQKDMETPDKKKNVAEAEEARKEAGDASNQQESAKSEEQAANGSSDGKEPEKAKTPNASQNRNLWITNISQTTRATELKQALSEHGKVIGAKVVINARYPGACCYGYVKMETVADADNCIVKLNNTELNGQIIRIEKVRPDHLNPLKNAVKKTEGKEKVTVKNIGKSTEKKDTKSDKPKDKKENDEKDKSRDDKTDKDKADVSISEGKEKKLETERSTSQKRVRRSRERIRKRSPSRDRRERSLSSRSRRREKELLTFDKIKDERDKERFRERERMVREEKRRREAVERQREIERRQRSEAVRLEREREKLRAERERLERERAEIMQLERERQKLEREKLELEKIELERVKMRMQEEERRTTAKRTSTYRRDDYEEKRRAPGDRHYEEAPPPPRFDPPSRPNIGNVKPREPSPKKFGSSASKDYKARMSYEKRDTYPPKRDRDYEPDRSHAQSSISRGPSNMNVFNMDRDRDVRDPRPRDNSGSIASNKYGMQKNSNYNESRDRDRDRSPHFRSMRDERRMNEHKGDMRPSRDHHYNDTSKDSRSFERGNGNSWGHPSASGKVFNNASNVPPKAWAKDSWRGQDSSSSGDRWNSGSGSRCAAPMSAPFSNNSNMNLGPPPCPPPCPPPPGINNYVNDRFDYKGMRKY